jgi:hypothetical protein
MSTYEGPVIEIAGLASLLIQAKFAVRDDGSGTGRRGATLETQLDPMMS